MGFQTKFLFYPLSLLVKLIYQTRRYLYEIRYFSSYRAPSPVISIGNIEMGGTGKTPVTAFLSETLSSENNNTAIVTRGYKGKKQRVILSRDNLQNFSPEEVGDEPYMLSKFFTNNPILVGKDRIRNIIQHLFFKQHAIFLLEDGFQHLKIQRDLDIVLVNGSKDLSQDKVFSSGRLREGKKSLSRADLVILTKCNGKEVSELEKKNIEEIRKYIFDDTPIFKSGIKFRELYDLKENKVVSTSEMPHSVFGLCGIGDPKSFKLSLEKEGFKIEKFKSFKNHHSFNGSDFKKNK